MTPNHPFRFGVQASTAANAAEWTALARTAETLGYSTLTMPDHFGDQLAPIPALMAAAELGHAGVVKLLVARGADRTATSKDGKTAADLATAVELKNLLAVK